MGLLTVLALLGGIHCWDTGAAATARGWRRPQRRAVRPGGPASGAKHNEVWEGCHHSGDGDGGGQVMAWVGPPRVPPHT